VKSEVAKRALRKGSRLADKRKRKLRDKLKGSKEQGKRRKQEAKAMTEEALRELGAPNSRDDKPKSMLCLMYNLVQGYVFAIIELWNHQVFAKLHVTNSVNRGTVTHQR
jgi:hypothetical protein